MSHILGKPAPRKDRMEMGWPAGRCVGDGGNHVPYQGAPPPSVKPSRNREPPRTHPAQTISPFRDRPNSGILLTLNIRGRGASRPDMQSLGHCRGRSKVPKHIRTYALYLIGAKWWDRPCSAPCGQSGSAIKGGRGTRSCDARAQRSGKDPECCAIGMLKC